MKSTQKNVAMGFAAGLVLGAVVLTSFGQNSTKTTQDAKGKKSTATKSTAVRNYTVPRYSVQYDASQKLLLITDNAYSQLYLYDTGSSGGSTLRSRIDLRQTGARQLKAAAPRSGGTKKSRKKSSKGTKSKATTKKPAPAKRAPKKKAPKKKV